MLSDALYAAKIYMNNDLQSSNFTKSGKIQHLLQEEITQGKYGSPGSIFMTTRSLAAEKNISLVTAHNILNNLCESGYLKLVGKNYVLLPKSDQHTQSIVLVLPTLNNAFFGELAENISSELAQLGYRTLIINTHYYDIQTTDTLSFINSLPIIGIISCVPLSCKDLSLNNLINVPILFLNHKTPSSDISSSLFIEDNLSVQNIAQYLLAQGYKTFAYIGTTHLSLRNDIRGKTFIKTINKAGYTLQQESIFHISENDKSNHMDIQQFLQMHTEPIGIFCYHDLIAAKLYDICHSIGKRIPQDVGIIGFDNLPIATLLTPSLTTVGYNIESLAFHAKQIFLNLLNTNNGNGKRFYIIPTLIERQSASLSANYHNSNHDSIIIVDEATHANEFENNEN